jgi:hypothetical protein
MPYEAESGRLDSSAIKRLRTCGPMLMPLKDSGVVFHLSCIYSSWGPKNPHPPPPPPTLLSHTPGHVHTHIWTPTSRYDDEGEMPPVRASSRYFSYVRKGACVGQGRGRTSTTSLEMGCRLLVTRRSCTAPVLLLLQYFLLRASWTSLCFRTKAGSCMSEPHVGGIEGKQKWAEKLVSEPMPIPPL